uniref:Uncharacterized protein n=1 Tax=Spongospora subterranea TaxID=70186 RepID=A0A0H5QP06_9EUKA|eukprot:CRZ03126.1 hypothetical protein [Spongospora subterranea]
MASWPSSLGLLPIPLTISLAPLAHLMWPLSYWRSGPQHFTLKVNSCSNHVQITFSLFTITLFWDENYGDSSVEIETSFKNAIEHLRQSPETLSLGIVQSLFESSMYIFVSTMSFSELSVVILKMMHRSSYGPRRWTHRWIAPFSMDGSSPAL